MKDTTEQPEKKTDAAPHGNSGRLTEATEELEAVTHEMNRLTASVMRFGPWRLGLLLQWVSASAGARVLLDGPEKPDCDCEACKEARFGLGGARGHARLAAHFLAGVKRPEITPETRHRQSLLYKPEMEELE